MNIVLVMPGKQPEAIEIDGSLESMQQIVGGLIQAIYPWADPVALVCNDEGKLLGLEPNRILMNEEGEVYDIICGTFFVCGIGREDFISLSPELMEKYRQVFELW